MIRVDCTGCNTVLNVDDDRAGRRAKCPRCGRVLYVPVPDAPEAAATPAGQIPLSQIAQASTEVALLTDNIVKFMGRREDAFESLVQAMVSLGGNIRRQDLAAGTLEAAWRYGVDTSGLRVTAQFKTRHEARTEITLTGSLKAGADARGDAQAKAREVLKAFLILVNPEQAAQLLSAKPRANSSAPGSGSILTRLLSRLTGRQKS